MTWTRYEPLLALQLMVGREPQVPGVIEDRYGLASKEWRFLVAASLVMVLCTLSGTLVEVVMFSISMWDSVPDLLWYSCT